MEEAVAPGIGLEVHSAADMAGAVAGGFNVKAIDALRENGVTEAEVGSLIINHRHQDAARITISRIENAG